jgi:hypothetical protein
MGRVWPRIMARSGSPARSQPTADQRAPRLVSTKGTAPANERFAGLQAPTVLHAREANHWPLGMPCIAFCWKGDRDLGQVRVHSPKDSVSRAAAAVKVDSDRVTVK